MLVIHAMLQMNSWEAIRGLGVWLKQMIGSTPLWITAAEAHAKGSFETACDEYIKALEVIPSGTVDSDLLNAPVVDFIVNRVSERNTINVETSVHENFCGVHEKHENFA